MPINITRVTDTDYEKIEWLCDGVWELPSQISALEMWLTKSQSKLQPDSYIADVGFCSRPDASGGGAALTIEAMRIMAELGMELHLSEYDGWNSAT
jgi:hypothetical protein